MEHQEYAKVSINVSEEVELDDSEIIAEFDQQVLDTFEWVGEIPLDVSVNRHEGTWVESSVTISDKYGDREYGLSTPDDFEPEKDEIEEPPVPKDYRCKRCGRSLSSVESRERGYGPTCFKIFKLEGGS